MEPIKKLLVCMDMSSMDVVLIKYANMLSKTLGVDQLSFVHVLYEEELPEEITRYLPDMDQPLDQVVNNEIQSRLDKYLDTDVKAISEVKVEKGNTSDTLLKTIKNGDYDLSILGKKTSFKGQGIVSGKVLRFANNNILILPEVTKYEIKKILVPLDFSKFSQMALELADYVAEKADAELICQNVYNVSVRYFPYIPTAEAGKSFRKHAEKEYNKFIKKAKIRDKNIHCEFTKDLDSDISQRIYDYAFTEEADILVAGTKGKTSATNLFIGSITEKLASHEKSIPLLVAKNKKENLNLLELILSKL